VSKRAILLATFALGLATAGCGGNSSVSPLEEAGDGAAGDDASGSGDGSPADAGTGDSTATDATVDAGAPPDGSPPDVQEATSPDGTADAAEAASDAPEEATADGGSDAPADAPSDALADVFQDASADALADVSQDSPADSSADAGEAGPDAEAGPPPPYCGDGGLLFCDGFENGLTPWSGTFVTLGSLAIDTTHVHAGSHALVSHTNAEFDGGAAYAAQVQIVQSWPAHLFTRFFVYEPSPAPPSTANLLDLDENFSPYGGLAFNATPSGLSMNSFNTGSDAVWASDGGTTLDDWVCFELELDTIQGASHLYMNDVEVTDLAQTNVNVGQIGIIGVGLTFYLPDPQGGQTMWFDDVAVNGSRIGCSAN
jgi:hypothetical protein